MKTEVHLYSQAKTGLFKGMNRFMTLISMLMVLGTVILGVFYAEQSAYAVASLRDWLTPFLEWYYVLHSCFFALFYDLAGCGAL